MAVKNYSKIKSLIIFLIVPANCSLLNIGFKCRQTTSFEAASELLLLILSKSRSVKVYLSGDNRLTPNQSTQRLYTGIKLLLLNTWSVVILYVNKSFILTWRNFLTFSVFDFYLQTVPTFCLDFDFMLVEENVDFLFFFISNAD